MHVYLTKHVYRAPRYIITNMKKNDKIKINKISQQLIYLINKMKKE